MKKIVVTVSMLCSVMFLMAGGDLYPSMSSAAEITNENCKTNKVYAERSTHLMWQDEAYVDAEDGAYKREHSVGKSGKANYAVNYCRNLNYMGFADWRLPTSDELQAIHRVPGQRFAYFRDGDFWTSTLASSGKNYVVFPADAYRYERLVGQSNYIRCVRCYDTPELKELQGCKKTRALESCHSRKI